MNFLKKHAAAIALTAFVVAFFLVCALLGIDLNDDRWLDARHPYEN